MTAPASKNQQSRIKHHSVPGMTKLPKGKGRVSLEQYRAAQRAALDTLRQAAGG